MIGRIHAYTARGGIYVIADLIFNDEALKSFADEAIIYSAVISAVFIGGIIALTL